MLLYELGKDNERRSECLFRHLVVILRNDGVETVIGKGQPEYPDEETTGNLTRDRLGVYMFHLKMLNIENFYNCYCVELSKTKYGFYLVIL